VGGMGNFNEIFLGNQENFRGCMDSIFFNGVDVLIAAKVKHKLKVINLTQNILGFMNSIF